MDYGEGMLGGGDVMVGLGECICEDDSGSPN